jgi:hypothetical protein
MTAAGRCWTTELVIRARQLRRMTPALEAVLATVTGKAAIPAPAPAAADARFQFAHRPPQCNDRRAAQAEKEAGHIGEEPWAPSVRS